MKRQSLTVNAVATYVTQDQPGELVNLKFESIAYRNDGRQMEASGAFSAVACDEVSDRFDDKDE